MFFVCNVDPHTALKKGKKSSILLKPKIKPFGVIDKNAKSPPTCLLMATSRLHNSQN